MDLNFAEKLNQYWDSCKRDVLFLEVDLFRALRRTVTSLSGDFHIEEYHGNDHQVAFGTTSPWSRRQLERCELSDLLIITFKKNPDLNIRMTFLQAKRSTKKSHDLCREWPSHKTTTTFSANLVQWDLLSNRPKIVGIPPFDPPSMLLKGAILRSVGSFLIFHKNRDDYVSFFYAAADALAPINSPQTKHARLQTLQGDHMRYVKGYEEQRLACCPEKFGDGLFSGVIGTPIEPQNTKSKTDEKYRRESRRWLATVIRNQDERGPIARELLHSIEPEKQDEFKAVTYNSVAPSSIIIIKTDNEKEG